MRQKRAGIVLIIAAALVAALAAPASAATQVVRSQSVTGWFGGNEGPGGSVGTVEFVPAAGAPVGDGAALLSVDANGRASFGTNLYKGTRVDQILQLKFNAFNIGGTTDNNVVLQFDFDADGTDANTTFQGRLTFQPLVELPADSWTTLDTQNATQGLWWRSQPGAGPCTQAVQCTWAQVLANFPDGAVRNDVNAGGAFLARLGGPIGHNASAYVDGIIVQTNTGTTTWDFEEGVSITPTLGPPGTAVTVKAFGFKPGIKVSPTYDTGKRRVKLCTFTVAPNGSGSCNGTIPTVTPGNVGVHNIHIQGRAPTGGKLVKYDIPYFLSA